MTVRRPEMPFWSRFAFMAMGWGAIGVVYTISGQRGAETAHRLVPTAIDRWFSFNPDMIWIYMSFFLFVPLGYFCTSPQRVKWLSSVMAISAACAAVVFGFFPTTMDFPAVTQQGVSAEALKLLMRYDAVVNCLPSLHVTLTFLTLCALWQVGHPWRNLLLSSWAVAIAISILPLYRHQFVDFLAGLALALFACFIAGLLKRSGLVLSEPVP
ncbi:phosphatase PAP2 family protein [Loktanella agnita]|uniref:phosphatase PAP2 family protein n=1 Tax=Loktanella agnita TaxID=287097 RepID=UPI003989892F